MLIDGLRYRKKHWMSILKRWKYKDVVDYITDQIDKVVNDKEENKK